MTRPSQHGMKKKRHHLSATQQPDWEFIDNLGDASPVDYGGYFIYRDRTGAYQEEAEYLVVEDEDADPDSRKKTHTVYRIGLDRLKLVGGFLVPLGYDSSWPHPVASYDEWFHKDLASVASFVGTTKEALEQDFTSADPHKRAWAYRAVYDYHGWENGDSDPLRMTYREAEHRYADELKKSGARLRGIGLGGR